MATDQQGRVTVLYYRDGVWMSSTRSVSGTWGPHERLPQSIASTGPRKLASDAAGNLTTAWAGGGKIYAQTRSSTGTWSAAREIASGYRELYTLDLSVGLDGDAVVTWDDYTFDRQGYESDYAVTAVLRRGQSWGSAETLAAGIDDRPTPTTVVGGDRRASVVWRTQLPGGQPRFEVHFSDAGDPPPDSDRDGVPDATDQCPTVAGDPPSGCPKPSYVTLGDSYSSGFGAGNYEPGTYDEDNSSNNCQRSDRAFGPFIGAARGMRLTFKACQGALTHDLLNPKNETWGERAQFDHLPGADLVTFSIGGNDAGFADALEECILGAEFLPFNTCSGDDKVRRPVQEALARLDNRRDSPEQVIPYDRLYKEARRGAPTATRVAVGYPEFYVEEGSDRTNLPGGRCGGVKKVDQRWIVEQIRAINGIIRQNALRNGFRFVDPSSRFDGHELCSEGPEWIFPLRSGLGLHAGRFHPTPEGQQAIAAAVEDELDAPPPGDPPVDVGSGETVSRTFTVSAGRSRLIVSTQWPGSDVVATLVSPTGQRYERQTTAAGLYHENGPTWEQFEVRDPQPGLWRVELYGADVDPQGEPVTLSTITEEPPNVPPVAAIAYQAVGNQLMFNANRSTDSDGSISGYRWYTSSSNVDSESSGSTTTLPASSREPRTVTLVVTDNDGATSFAAVTIAATPTPSKTPTRPAVTQGSKDGPLLLPQADREAPRLRSIRVQKKVGRRWRTSRRITRRARVTMRVSEDARVTLRLERRGRKQRARSRSWNLRAGRRTLTLAGLLRRARAGRQRLTLVAKDPAGNVRRYKVGFSFQARR